MARIVLEPGEVFEHYHSYESYSIRVSGQLELTVGSKSIKLLGNKREIIPANTPHSITNIGKVIGAFDCGSHSTETTIETQ
jgi:mannose-6-phosphate isomerase-like protein (cupin superfamily)